MRNKIVLFGGSGKLGTAIKEYVSKEYQVYYPTHEECNITNPDDLESIFLKYQPNIVINTAALVGIKECERDKKLAWQVNVGGSLNIVKKCLHNKVRLVFISSAVIFDGKEGEYSEEAVPSPMNYYALTKVAAEQAVSVLDDSAIIRLDFFPKDKLKYNQVFSDHYTSKIPVQEAAEKTLRIATSTFTGIINIGRKRDTLFNILKPAFPDITPIQIRQSAMPDFPQDISLNLQKWHSLFANN